MNHIFKFSLLFSLSATSLMADPLIECSSPEYNFGTRIAIEPVSHEFILWNRGDSTVTVSNVKGCCGTSVTLKPMEILPGSNAVCTATFNTRNRHGKQVKQIEITSNAQNQPLLKLKMEGILLQPVEYSPRVVRFVPDPDGGSLTQRITVTNLMNTAIELHSASTRIVGIQTAIKQLNERAWVVELTASSELASSKLGGNIQLNFSFGQINIPVFGKPKVVFHVAPKPVVEYTSTSTNEMPRLVTLISDDKQPFEIISAKLKNVKGSVELHKRNDHCWEFTVVAIPSSIQRNSVLQIRTNSNLQPFVLVPIILNVP